MAQWDALPDSEQEWWRTRHRQRATRHVCGHDRSVCEDPDRHWYPQMDVCYPTMHQQAAQAAYERLHEKRPWHDGTFTSWVEKPDERHQIRWDHGVTIWAAETDHGHGGNFTTQENPWADHDD